MMPAFDNALLGAHRSLTARRMLPSPDRPEADRRGAFRERREISLSTPPGVPYPGKMVVHNDGSLPRRLEPPFMKVKFAAKTRLQAGT